MNLDETFAARIGQKGEFTETSAMLWNEITMTNDPTIKIECAAAFTTASGIEPIATNSQDRRGDTRSAPGDGRTKVADLVKAGLLPGLAGTRLALFIGSTWKATRKLIQRGPLFRRARLEAKTLSFAPTR